jgi:sugar lactone lactonase YvrE
MAVELAEAVAATLGEGPSLFPDGTLKWVDIPEGKVFSRHDGISQLVTTYAYEVSKVLPWAFGHVALTAQGVELVSSEGRIVSTVDVTGGDPTLRCSDGTVLPSGGIAVGVVDKSLTPGRGRLVVIHTDGSTATIAEGASIPNGIDVNPTGDRVWWVDSPTQTIVTLDVNPATGSLEDPQPWAHIPESWGIPDGLCADQDGGVWVALFGGGAIIHFTAEAAHDHTITIPVSHVTSVAFDASNTLIVTSGNVLLSDNEKKSAIGAGGLWAVSPREHRTAGLPPRIAQLDNHLFATHQ